MQFHKSGPGEHITLHILDVLYLDDCPMKEE